MREELVEEKTPALIRNLEMQSLSPEVRSDPVRLGRLLADHFREIGQSGKIYHKGDVLAQLKESPGESFRVHEFTVICLTPGIALASYRVERLDGAGKSSSSLRSSLWQDFGGEWRMVFHQGTPL